MPLIGGRGLQQNSAATSESFDFRSRLSSTAKDYILSSGPETQVSTAVAISQTQSGFFPLGQVIAEMELKHVKINVQTLSAAQTLSVALYNYNYDTTKLSIVAGSSAILSLAATGIITKEFTVPIMLYPNTKYFLGFVSSDVTFARVYGYDLTTTPNRVKLFTGALPTALNLWETGSSGVIVPNVVYLTRLGKECYF